MQSIKLIKLSYEWFTYLRFVGNISFEYNKNAAHAVQIANLATMIKNIINGCKLNPPAAKEH